MPLEVQETRDLLVRQVLLVALVLVVPLVQQETQVSVVLLAEMEHKVDLDSPVQPVSQVPLGLLARQVELEPQDK